MTECIERESAKRAVDYAVELSNSEYDAVCNALDGIPAADVVPVVRCKDCNQIQRCKFGQYLGLDGYCSLGEREDSGNAT